jgi:glucose-6-phosphate 1-dehydrogenase
MNIFILFGITGNLAKNKVIPALVELEKKNIKSAGKQLCIGIGRKPSPPTEFGDIQSRLYVSGALDSVSTYKRIKKIVYDTAKAMKTAKGPTPINLIAYSSLPPHMHVGVARLFRKYAIDEKLNAKFHIQLRFLFEKPIGTDLASATKDIASLHSIFGSAAEHRLYFVDHYLFKERLCALGDCIKAEPELFADSIGSSGIGSVEAVLYESEDVADRAVFYDAVGALNDVGQNHMLQLLVEGIRMREIVLMEKNADKDRGGDEKIKNGKITKIRQNKLPTKAQMMQSLKIIGNPLFGQYKGYAEIPSIRHGSKTETFFRVEAMYDYDAGKDIGGFHGKSNDKSNARLKCAISSGKKLGISKSGLIFKDEKHGRELFIDMSNGTKDAYLTMFEKAVEGDREAFAQEAEILAGWKFVKRAKQIRTKKLTIYEKLEDLGAFF